MGNWFEVKIALFKNEFVFYSVRFEFLTAAVMRRTFFRVVAPFCVIEVH
jgi:hypothetical protein